MGIAAAVLLSGLAGAAGNIFAAHSAADAQTAAANQATQAQLAMFGITRAGLQPFIRAGTAGANRLVTNMRNLIKPIRMDQKTLEATPGYKFTLGQGLKATQNSASARGLGVSGAALKGAATYATGLSDATYNERFANALSNKNFTLDALTRAATIGGNAAAAVGNAATQTGSSIGSNVIGAGNAQAGRDIATGNAFSGGANALVQALLAQQQFGSGDKAIGVYS